MIINEVKLNVTSKNNIPVVTKCEEIALANHVSNGGTLQFLGLVETCSDYIIYCTHNGKIVAYMSLVKDFTIENDLYIMQVAVLDDYKQMGIGSLMFDYAIKHSKGHSFVTSHVNKNNLASIKTHQKFGFKEEHQGSKVFFYMPTIEIKNNKTLPNFIDKHSISEQSN